MQEIWKDIYFIENGIEYDYRRLYQVSSKGRVKSLSYNHTGKERILKAAKTKDGYLHVQLCTDKKKKWFRVNRLVAFMFIPNDDPEHKTDVNHIDENKENNLVENLEWCNRKQNCNHGTRNEKIAKSLSKKVIGCSLTDTKVIILQSTQQAKKFGFNQGNICECCNGRRKSHKGYRWYYL